MNFRSLWIALILGMSLTLQAKTIRAPHDAQAFDFNNPSVLVGIFLEDSKLEIKGKPNAQGLVPVIYHPKEGLPSPAYCRAVDLDMDVEEPSSPDIQAKNVTNSLNEGLALAAKTGKFLFIAYGHDSDVSCQALAEMIRTKQVEINPKHFILVDLNSKNPEENQAFAKKFKVNSNKLPIIVIADSKGKQLVARTGYGKVEDFKNLIQTVGNSTGKN